MDSETKRHHRDIARYYRWLDRLAWFSERRSADGHEAHPIHRALRDPDDPAAAPSPLLLHRLLLDGLDLPPDPAVLDAGCGYGATAFDLQPVIGGDWLGLTLSAVQARRGAEEAARRGLAARIRFQVGSYDAPLDRRFDLVIGIESMIHSPDPARTVANLAAALRPGGYLAMVDDMPAEGAARTGDLATFTRMWRCPVAPSGAGWAAAMRQAGLEIATDRDLSALCVPRDPAVLAPLIAEAARRVRWLAPLGLGLRTQADLGGMALERLIRAGVVEYRLLVGRRPMAAPVAAAAQHDRTLAAG